MKCPKCNAECWRDEHPDGIAVGTWGCFVCEWAEEKVKDVLVNLNDIPF